MSITSAVVRPPGGYWPHLERAPADDARINLRALPMDRRTEWWHRVLNIGRYQRGLGSGIRVGVVDSGVGPHPHLSATPIGSFLDGGHDSGRDVRSHGTHVAGTIAATPPAGGKGYAGVAPGVELFGARVFREVGEGGASQADIAQAVEALSKDCEADLIHISVGAPYGSDVLQDALVDALERGTLCVCAAGNEGGPITCPAAFPETLAISAVGRQGWPPPETLSASRYPDSSEKTGAENLFLADFSSSGSDLTAAAPGVGIIATVPERFGREAPYLAMDGTSMASPAACGALANRLASDGVYTSLPRNASRPSRARILFGSGCKDIDLPEKYQGRGLAQSP